MKPKTKFRVFGPAFIAAQPDLQSFDGRELFEFKLYPIDTYARVQSSIFAYVWQRPIKLVGLIEEEGFFRVVKELIPPPRRLEDVGVTSEHIKSVMHEQLWCVKRNAPADLEHCYYCPTVWGQLEEEENWEEEWD